MINAPTASHSLTVRLEIQNKPGMLGKVTSAIGKAGGDIGAIDLVEVGRNTITRDITFKTSDERHGQQVVERLRAVEGVSVVNVSDRTFLMHLGGKIEVKGKMAVKTRDDLSMAYTPGVARVCMAIHHDPEKAYTLTIKQNTVAVVTDGSAVLGLGDIGPSGAQPVMEGKALIFKEFAGVDAFPICLATKDVDEIVMIVKAHRAGLRRHQPRGHLGAALLRDRGAAAARPRHPRVPRRPARHRGGGAGRPAERAQAREEEDVGRAHRLHRRRRLRHRHRQAPDEGGRQAHHRLRPGRRHLQGPHREHELDEGVVRRAHQPAARSRAPPATRWQGADVFIGLSGPGVVSLKDIKAMNRDAIVFAMANPIPEILPEEAGTLVRVMATGRSDYPNQINNSCGFPGFFRGMLDVRARRVNDEMKLAAAHAIAGIVGKSELSEEYITPSMFDSRLVPAVSAVADAAIRTGVARKKRTRPS